MNIPDTIMGRAAQFVFSLEKHAVGVQYTAFQIQPSTYCSAWGLDTVLSSGSN